MKQENYLSVVFNIQWCYMKEFWSHEYAELDFPIAGQIGVLIWQICVVSVSLEIFVLRVAALRLVSILQDLI